MARSQNGARQICGFALAPSLGGPKGRECIDPRVVRGGQGMSIDITSAEGATLFVPRLRRSSLKLRLYPPLCGGLLSALRASKAYPQIGRKPITKCTIDPRLSV